MMAAFVRYKTSLIIIFDNLGVKMRPPRGDLFHPKTPENGFFGPPESGNPERAHKIRGVFRPQTFHADYPTY
jgi:hypothetical protein